MKHLLLSILIFGFGISGSLGQTIKSLGFNTTNGQVVYSGTNVLTFANSIKIGPDITLTEQGILGGGYNGEIDFEENDLFTGDGNWNFQGSGIDGAGAITFNNTTNAATTRANLGFSTNLNTFWTATNATQARINLGIPSIFGDGSNSVISGGEDNLAIGQWSVVGGGRENWAFSQYSSVLGGWQNIAQGAYSTVAGGIENEASATGSFASGSRAKATNDGSFVWSDYNTNNFSSLIPNTFNIRASSGMSLDLGNSGISFRNSNGIAPTRTNLGLGATWLTNTNVSSFREAIGLGTTNTVIFSNVVNNGDFTNNNGTIYGLKTNVGPFEGIGNLFASNNTTVGNETLFRVGVAETTNKSAQFGFRAVRTNNGGEGLAVFSVFGYNALMMIGPSDRSRSNSLTNTNAAIEADIWTMSETNRVMTLRDTNTGATVMHRPIGFNTNEVSTAAPSNTTVTNPTGWIQIYVGTNSVRVPYYQ